MNIIISLIVILLLGAIYLKLCKLLENILHLKELVRETNKHIIGDPDNPESVMIKPSLKELVVNRCLGIENEIVRLRYGVFGGDRSPSLDKVNILDTLVDIKALLSKDEKVDSPHDPN